MPSDSSKALYTVLTAPRPMQSPCRGISNMGAGAEAGAGEAQGRECHKHGLQSAWWVVGGGECMARGKYGFLQVCTAVGEAW